MLSSGRLGGGGGTSGWTFRAGVGRGRTNGVAREAAVRSRYASASTAGRMIDAGVFSTPASRSRLEEPGLPHPRQLKLQNPVRKYVSEYSYGSC